MTTLHKSSQDQLRQYIEKAERIEEDIKEMKGELKDLFLEAKASGFDPKIMKKVLALRKKDPNERTEEEALIDTYLAALDGTPLGDWAASRRDHGERDADFPSA